MSSAGGVAVYVYDSIISSGVQVGKGRPLYCRRSWESDHTYDLVIPCDGGGPGQLVAKTEPIKGLSAACYVRLTTRVSRTNA